MWLGTPAVSWTFWWRTWDASTMEKTSTTSRLHYFSDSANNNLLISFLFSVKCWFDFFGAASQGLVTNLTLGEYVLTDWTMYSLSIDEAINQGIIDEDGAAPEDPPQPAALSLPTFYRGSFIIPDGIPDLPQDTYIKLPSWRKACDLFLLFILHVL